MATPLRPSALGDTGPLSAPSAGGVARTLAFAEDNIDEEAVWTAAVAVELPLVACTVGTEAEMRRRLWYSIADEWHDALEAACASLATDVGDRRPTKPIEIEGEVRILLLYSSGG